VGTIEVVFPDLTRKPWSLRLGEEFNSGACHAGRFETSVVLAVSPELVRENVRRALPSNPKSLSVAIREGKTTFSEAGGPDAYFGHPAEASAKEGEATIETLGAILEEAVLAARGAA
jgi:creatinine amidohydrolase